jgi:uncharacterized protein with HEPN domain
MRNSLIGDKVRLLHVLEAISEVETYIVSLDREAFLNNSLTRNASLTQI